MSPQTQTTIDVQGMACRSCVILVHGVLRDFEGVSSVDVDLRSGQLVIEHHAEEASIESLLKALNEAGYDAQTRQP